MGLGSVEELIIYCARVSNPDNQLNMETAPKLLGYLINHKHWSPFEMAHMVVEIQTSRAIAAQILRHRSFSFQEFSQRYASPSALEPVELRMEHEKNRQSSSDVCDEQITIDLFNELTKAGKEFYDTLIKMGIARETARMVLPLCTQTTMYMSGTVRSWIHYLDLRDDDHVQKEHREIAQAIKSIFIGQFPWTSRALGWTDET